MRQSVRKKEWGDAESRGNLVGWEWWRWKWGRYRTWNNILSDCQKVVCPKMKFSGCLWTLRLWSVFYGSCPSHILLVSWLLFSHSVVATLCNPMKGSTPDFPILHHLCPSLVLWKGCQKAAGFCLKPMTKRKIGKVLFLETSSTMQTPGQACDEHVHMALLPKNLSHWCVGTRQLWHKTVGPFASVYSGS